MSRVPLADYPATDIAVIKPSALGDIAHALPVLGALRAKYPAARITWVVNRSYESLLVDHPALDATLPFDRGALKRGPLAAAGLAWSFGHELKRRRFDLAIDLQCLLRTGLMTLATAAPRRVGLSSAREGAHFAYTDAIADDTNAHAVDRYWRVAEALGVGGIPKRFDLPIDAAALDWACNRLSVLPRPWLVLAVGARWLTKRWPPERFADLVRPALRDRGGSAVFVGAPDEVTLSRRCAEQLAAPTLDLCGITTLPQLVAVLSLADVVVSNDTGPLHLAAALGRPVVAPYTCTRVARHGPYGQFHATAATRVPCAGSYRRECDHLSCMNELSPARLAGPLSEALRRWPTSRSA